MASLQATAAYGDQKKKKKKKKPEKDLTAMEEYPGEKKKKGSKEEAKKLFMKAVEAFAEENYVEALKYFQESYELNPKLKVLYNIGMCQRALFDFKTATGTFKLYLKAGGKKIPKKKRKQVQELIIEMETSLAQLTIITNESGARILIDAEEIGITPLQSILEVNPGGYTIEAEKEGFFTAKETVVVSSGDHEVVSLTLVPEIAVAGAVEETGDKDKDKKKKKILKHALLWGILGAVVVSGVTTAGILGYRANAGKASGPSADWTVHGR